MTRIYPNNVCCQLTETAFHFFLRKLRDEVLKNLQSLVITNGHECCRAFDSFAPARSPQASRLISGVPSELCVRRRRKGRFGEGARSATVTTASQSPRRLLPQIRDIRAIRGYILYGGNSSSSVVPRVSRARFRSRHGCRYSSRPRFRENSQLSTINCSRLFLVRRHFRQLWRKKTFFFLVQRNTRGRDDLRSDEDDEVLFGVLFCVGTKCSAN
jgi:hypothetical protein